MFGQLEVLLAALLDALGSSSERVVAQVGRCPTSAGRVWSASRKAPSQPSQTTSQPSQTRPKASPQSCTRPKRIRKAGWNPQRPRPQRPRPRRPCNPNTPPKALSVLGDIAGHPLHFRSVLMSLLDRWGAL